VRYFGATRAVAELDLHVPRGSIYGLLGENGCGKTTTINMIMGALLPNQGTVRVFGEDPLTMQPATRARIGYLADEMELPKWMSLKEAIELHSSYFSTWDRDELWRLMEIFELTATQTFGALSKGQKRRFLIALIVAQRPDLLILDEPSGGLDVGVRRQFLDLLVDIAGEREITILIASHILSDVERVVDRVAFVKDGRTVREAALEDLKGTVKRLCLPLGSNRCELEKRFDILSLQETSDVQLATVSNFDEERLDGLECRIEHLNLEELFLLYNEQAAVEGVPA
ncbi:MAG: ABC transporter ATP-binding protein, partial [Lentisphaerae bacterium]|nr:ABC transporter ATP-binding protein [Lentisphaerota bacterium]